MGVRAEDIFVENTISVGGLPLHRALIATSPEQCLCGVLRHVKSVRRFNYREA
jgi:hypothetical protein